MLFAPAAAARGAAQAQAMATEQAAAAGATERAAEGSRAALVAAEEGERPGAAALATLPALGGLAEEAGAVLGRASQGSYAAATE